MNKRERRLEILKLQRMIETLQKDQAEILCNLCGLTCCLTNGPANDPFQDECGLIEQKVWGGYPSTPGNGDGALDDLECYKFSMCEFCLDWLFTQFKIPPSIRGSEYENDDYPVAFRSASQRVKEDDWRSQKDKFFAEFEKRNVARSKK